MNIAEITSKEINATTKQVEAAIQLLDEGNTVPFISRYRKEVTGGLTDTQLRTLEERLYYLRELEERRQAILKSIREQNKLTTELEKEILEADNKSRLEDLYLPYKPKRHTKAQIAREAGLQPLADKLLTDPTLNPETIAAEFINPEKNIPDITAALLGARHILLEQFAEDAELIGRLREYLWENAVLKSDVIADKQAIGAKFADYFAFSQPIKKIPSYRALAMFRGQREAILRIYLTFAEEIGEQYCISQIAKQFQIEQKGRAADTWLYETATLTWRTKLFIKLELELLSQLREIAEQDAIKVFAHNLKDLLMAAPAGQRTTMGLDPGLRTGVKVAIVDKTGNLLAHTAIYPHAPQKQWEQSLATLAELCKKHHVEIISIGNGTASRETDKLAAELIKSHSELNLTKIVVSEAGASVYSASVIAATEFPDLDVSFRGAVSIARRLQDPLAELVKIEPKSIGVGQYQHDVSQLQLARNLDSVVEDCVNGVGVNLNTASMPLLARVAGLNKTLAANIVQFRQKQGAFSDRNHLKQVPRLGDKSFEQAAGFLRIIDGANPLDASAVHPEAYPVIEKILLKNNKTIKEIIGNSEFLRNLNPQEYVDDHFGLPTVQDIIKELDKPGLDPRPEFKTATFKEGVFELKDLKAGMIMEGVVTNITDFGAFVDVGVHQDGLVHKSAMSHQFVKDPRSVVKVGDIVSVKVIEIDADRKRINLSMRLEEKAEKSPDNKSVIHIKKNNSSQKPHQNNKSNSKVFVKEKFDPNKPIMHSKATKPSGQPHAKNRETHRVVQQKAKPIVNSIFGDALTRALGKN